MSASAAKVSRKEQNSNHDGADETSGKVMAASCAPPFSLTCASCFSCTNIHFNLPLNVQFDSYGEPEGVDVEYRRAPLLQENSRTMMLRAPEAMMFHCATRVEHRARATFLFVKSVCFIMNS